MSTAANEAERAELLKALPKLQNPIWRLHNLYSITNKLGKVVKFRPTREQNQLIEAVYLKGEKRHCILKARQMGFSTLIDVMILDACYFGQNVQASIVDRTQPDAVEKLETKVRFPFQNIGPLSESPTVDNDGEISWANGSTIHAGKNARGGTNQWLHISEWGPIAHEDPKRSEEIKTGALPSAEQGNIFVETTFKGGKGGHLYDLMKRAMETPEEHRTDKDFRFWFFPWYLDKTYTLEGSVDAISAKHRVYLNEKEQELGLTFTPGQRLWYHKTSEEQGLFMGREYPTTPEEAFRTPVEGAVFGDVISNIRAAGRITSYEWDRAAPVFSSWDIGWNDSTSVWLVQIIGRELSWIWHLRESGRTAAEIAAAIRATGIPVAGHFLPHDAGHKGPKDGKTYKDALEEAGFVNIKVVPRCTSIWPGIDALRKRFAMSWFRKDTTQRGIDALEAYHTKKTGAGGSTVEEPVHDWASHDCSAARTFAEALELNMVNTAQAKKIIHNAKPVHPDAEFNLDAVQEVRRKSRSAALSGGIIL